MNPGLTLETILSFTRINQFVSRFSSDPAHGDKPFGMVALLSAYEHEELSPRVRRHEDNMIWLNEPTRVFSKVIQAAWPQAAERLKGDRVNANVDAALSELETAYRKSLQKLPASVYNGPEQSAATDNLLRLADLASFQESETLSLLRLHQSILAAAGNCKPP